MPVKFKRKILKKRGTKNCGHGMKKKHRGGGSRGGRGNAGLMKHKFTKMLKECPDHFSNKGFTSLGRKNISVVNVSDLEGFAKKGIVDLPDVKILGRGKLKESLKVKALGFSSGARKKIEEAGGSIEEYVIEMEITNEQLFTKENVSGEKNG